MNLKVLFLCLILTMLITSAELRKHKRKHKLQVEDGAERKRLRDRVTDILDDFFYQIVDSVSDDDDDEDDDRGDWIFELQEPDGQCNPNPCLNNGTCEEKGKRRFKCDCPEGFKGKKCQKARKHCKRGRCGRGECVLTSVAPFYQCKCKEPFQPPDCRTVSLCEPNPCKNGGTCIRDEDDFDCECKEGFRGQFCHVGPNDCYVDDGESYRGNVSETDDGRECLHWNSHFILERGVNPFTAYEDDDGLGPHNFCRNPDGDAMPWCFIRKGRKLWWDYCDVTECSDSTAVVPTGVSPPGPQPQPTAPQPQPTGPQPQPTAPQPKPTLPQPKPPAPQPQPTVPQPKPTDPQPTSPSTLEQFKSCGKPEPRKPLTRIYGGLKVNPGALPWQVSLQARPKGTSRPHRHLCGGVLIKSCWVLTAAHCIDPKNELEVVAGSLSLDLQEPTEQTLVVEETIVHENYRETPAAVYNDIALLKLRGANGICANETQFVKAACLPDAAFADGSECTIAGWGATEQSQYGSSHLLDAQVLLIDQQMCSDKKVYGNAIDDSMFCAGYLQGGTDSCQGDSGGPLTCERNNTHFLYGLVSWGDKCAVANKPGVYAKVSHFLDWIKAKTQAV